LFAAWTAAHCGTSPGPRNPGLDIASAFRRHRITICALAYQQALLLSCGISTIFGTRYILSVLSILGSNENSTDDSGMQR
jgi:hypothetical protein